MGSRRNRKRDRRAAHRDRDFGPGFESAPRFRVDPFERDDLFAVLNVRPPETTLALSCGTCREFVEDANGGRGTCLHPGSGILGPWTDTPACDFHLRRRGH